MMVPVVRASSVVFSQVDWCWIASDKAAFVTSAGMRNLTHTVLNRSEPGLVQISPVLFVPQLQKSQSSVAFGCSVKLFIRLASVT